MKIYLVDVLSSTDAMFPNVYTQQQKRDWVYALEAQIRTFTELYTGQEADLDFLEEPNAELTLGKEDIDIYVYYLLSKIHMANNDVAMYNNHTAMFNGLMRDWQKKHRRENIPAKNTAIGY